MSLRDIRPLRRDCRYLHPSSFKQRRTVQSEIFLSMPVNPPPPRYNLHSPPPPSTNFREKFKQIHKDIHIAGRNQSIICQNLTTPVNRCFYFRTNSDNSVQKFLENAFFRSFSVICELFFPPSPISMLKIVIFVLHKVVLSR